MAACKLVASWLGLYESIFKANKHAMLGNTNE